MRFAYLPLLVCLVLFSHQAFAWWNTNYLDRRPILFPDTDLNKGNTVQIANIDFSAWTVLAGLDDIRIVDENHTIEIDRLCDGTDATTDGNCFFRLPYPLDSDATGKDTMYYVYYNNTGAGAPPDDNVARTSVCGWENDSACFFTADNGDQNSDRARFGIYSDFMTGTGKSIQLDAGLDGNADFNYSIWFLDVTGVAGAQVIYLNSGGTEICQVGVASSVFTVKNAASSGNYSADTWYQVQIRYHDNAATCYYAIYNANGSVFYTVSGGAGDTAAITAIVSGGHVGSGFFTHWDNYYQGQPSKALGLGAEEAYGGTPASEMDLNINKIEGYSDQSQQYPQFTYSVDGNLTIDFNVLNSDNNRMAFDMNYSSTDAQGSGTVIVTDVNLAASVCTDQNFVTNSSCTWDWNIALIPDGNYYILMDLNYTSADYAYSQTHFDATSKSFKVAAPHLYLQFRDENTGVPLTGLKVEFAGGSYTTASDGTLDINISGAVTGEQTIEAWEDNNYPRRFFTYDVNGNTELDLNLYMIQDDNSQYVEFRFYNPDQLTLTVDQRIRVYRDENLCSIRDTNAGGETSFWIDPDANYVFEVVDGDDVNRYYQTMLTIKIPLDEADSTAISPYNLVLSGWANGTQSGLTADFTYYFLPNTIEKYVFDVNGGISYYAKAYSVSVRGNPVTYTIQPYLSRIVDTIQPAIHTKNSVDNSAIPGVFIESYKVISGSEVLVESLTTDAAGIAVFSFIQGDEYRLKFYLDNNLLHTETLRPEYSNYYVYLDIGGFDWTEPTLESIQVSGFPTTGYIPFDSQGYDFNITVAVTNGTLETSWFAVANSDGNLSFNTSCGSSCSYHATATDLNNTTISLIVFVETESGKTFYEKYQYVTFDTNGYSLIESLRGVDLRKSFGCSTDINEPCFGLLFIAIMLTLGAMAVAGSTITTDTSAMAVISLICLGIFHYFTWIPLPFFVLAAIVAFASLVLSRRES